MLIHGGFQLVYNVGFSNNQYHSFDYSQKAKMSSVLHYYPDQQRKSATPPEFREREEKHATNVSYRLTNIVNHSASYFNFNFSEFLRRFWS